MVLLVVVPFLIWGVATVGFLLSRRRKVTLQQAQISGVVTADLPDGRPLSTARGGVWLGGMAITWPFVVLELHPAHLVVRSPQGVFQQVVVPRDAIGRLRIDRGVLGPSLKVEDLNGHELDFAFRAFSARSLRATLSNAGWLGLLAT